MIIGTYPCCDGDLFLALPDGIALPCFCKRLCPHCGATVWHRLSNIDPESWTEADFLATHEIDEATKMIKDRVVLQ